MLDFYILSDSQRKPKPDELREFKYAGGLEAGTFDRLIKKGIIDSRFDVYSDFRWGNKILRQIDIKTRDFRSDSDVKALKKIIDKALKTKNGLIAYGD